MGQEAKIDARLKTRFSKICLATIGMGFVIYATQYILWDSFQMVGIRYLALLALITAGAVSYGVVLLATGGLQKSDIRQFLRK